MKTGDLVKVDYVSSLGTHYDWVGVVMGVYGHKLEFLIDGEIDIWRMTDLEVMEAEVLNEGR